MSEYTTGELAKLCNVSVRTVQYYDTRGILIPSELSEGGRRLYSENDLQLMKVICFLRDLDISINMIAKLLNEENFEDVIMLVLDEQQSALKSEIEEKEQKLEKLEEIKKALMSKEKPSMDALSDIACNMENNKQLRKMRKTMLFSAIPIEAIEIVSIILWIIEGICWPFIAYTAIVIPYAIWISSYYFKRVAYICPHCHETFFPNIKEAFFASHTMTTRRLTCPSCKKKGFCVETYKERGSKNI